MLKFYTNTKGITHTPSSSTEEFDFGKVKKDHDTSLKVFIEGNNLTDLTTKSTCGCTVAEPNRENENLYSVDITYKNSHIVKPFGKTVTVKVKENGVEKTKSIKIKGIIE